MLTREQKNDLLKTLKQGDSVIISDVRDSYGTAKRKRGGTRLRTGDVLTVSEVVPMSNYVAVYCQQMTSPDYLTQKNINFERTNFRDKGISSLDEFNKELDRIEQKRNDLSNRVLEIHSKIKFMEEMGTDQFNPIEYQAWKVLGIIEQNPNMSRVEKAKQIAKIVKE